MLLLLHSRRTFLAALGIACLMVLDLVNKEPVAAHIVAIVVAVAGANAMESLRAPSQSDTGRRPDGPAA